MIRIIRSDLVGVVMIPRPGGQAPIVLSAGDTIPPDCTVGPHVMVIRDGDTPAAKPKRRKASGAPAPTPDVDD